MKEKFTIKDRIDWGIKEEDLRGLPFPDMKEPKIDLKMYVVVPKNPRMTAGKIASQVAHATFMALEMTDKKLVEKWKYSGMCVIVLECKNPVQMMGIDKYLDQWKVPHYIYVDEGLTEIPMGTPTALATGVMPEDQHWMLSQLNLYTEHKPKRRWFR